MYVLLLIVYGPHIGTDGGYPYSKPIEFAIDTILSKYHVEKGRQNKRYCNQLANELTKNVAGLVESDSLQKLPKR